MSGKTFVEQDRQIEAMRDKRTEEYLDAQDDEGGEDTSRQERAEAILDYREYATE
jgi:hypothetical protein